MVTNAVPSIPKWLKSKLVHDDIDQVVRAIHQAEADTDGEIVPFIVRRSVPVSHGGSLCVLSLWLLAAPVALIVGSQHHWLLLAALATALAWLGLWLGTTGFVIRLITPNPEIDRLVWQRAKAEFYNEGIGRTKRSTGILIFLSMDEHRAVVLADHAIGAKHPPETWQEVCDLVTGGLRNGTLKDGLCQAIARSGAIIRPYFPKAIDTTNELPDRLVIRE
ncbi:MAG: hypothetical protein FJ146_02320 [Deltaproteobacteria bacterium]|nr:hypothetical protein [Deltaproteobacteria bacterium]